MSRIDRDVLKKMFEPGSGYSWLTECWGSMEIAEIMVRNGANVAVLPADKESGQWWQWQSYNFYRQAVETKAIRHPKL